MNYINIPTTIYPSYNYLAAENAFLKQTVEFKDAVLCEQQAAIVKFQADVQQLSQSNMTLKQERDRAVEDAERWRVMQQIIKTQGSDKEAYVVQKTVDSDIDRRKSKKG